MLRSWKLGTAFGIGIYVHWTFLLLPILLRLNGANFDSPADTLFLLGVILAVFGCVVLHELGHALTAGRFGIPTRDITLYPIGGVARLERMTERPREELLIALAGPTVNVVLVGVLWPLCVLLRGLTLGEFVFNLLVANATLACFNLVPAFPMDGGRVLRALLTVRLGFVRATEIAARLGTGMALLFAFVGIRWTLPSFLLLSVFVFLMGQQELFGVRARAWQRQQEPLDVLPADEQTIDVAHRPSSPAFTGFTWDPNLHLWVEWRNGRAVNVIPVR